MFMKTEKEHNATATRPLDVIEICKALSNQTRLNILSWLKHPKENFPPQGGCLDEPVDLKGGVCMSSIQAKAGLTPATVSNFLHTLQRAGLLLSERHGKWTYYRRDEETIRRLAAFLGQEL